MRESNRELFDAVRSGDTNLVAKLLGEVLNVEVKGAKNETPLCVAAFKGNYPIARLLISKNANVNVQDNDGRTPLHYAALSNELDVTKSLVEEGIEIDANGNNINMINLSLDKGTKTDDLAALIDHLDIVGKLLAAGDGFTAVVKLLLENNADPTIVDKNNRLPIHWAAENGKKRVVKLLMDKYPIQRFIRDNLGKMPIHWAAQTGKKTIVKLLIDEDPTQRFVRDNLGKMPIHWAAENGKKRVVELLIDEDPAQMYEKDKAGKMPIHWAAENGKKRVVELLIDEDPAQKNAQDDKEKKTPREWAVQNNQQDIIDLLDDTEVANKITDKLKNDQEFKMAVKGDTGAPGLRGSLGKKGERGYSGLKGDIGPRGPQGNKGNQGLIGTLGSKGDQGSQGLRGAPGFDGSPGLKGDLGPKGEKGNVGTPGLKGNTGDQGVAGVPGLQGPVALKGDQGIQGPKGDKGERGIDGQKGDIGPRGTQGLKGNMGLVGPKGEDGIDVEEASRFLREMNKTKIKIQDAQEAAEIARNASQNSAKGAQETEGKVTKLHTEVVNLTKEARIFKEEADNFADQAFQSKRNAEELHSKVQNIFCEIKSTDQVCTVRRTKRETKDLNDQSLTNGASRSSSWINAFANTVVDASQGAYQFISSSFKPAIDYGNSQSAKAMITQSADINGTLLLLDVLIRKITGQKRISMANQSIPLLEARGYALNIIEKFEEVLKDTAEKFDISVNESNFNFFKTYQAVEGKMISGELSEIPAILYSAAKGAFRNCEQADKLLATFKVGMEKTLTNNRQQKVFVNAEKIVIDNEQPRSFMSNVTLSRNFSAINQEIAGYLR